MRFTFFPLLKGGKKRAGKNVTLYPPLRAGKKVDLIFPANSTLQLIK